MERMAAASLAMQRLILQAIEHNTAAVNENTAAVRLIASPSHRVSGSAGIPTAEQFPKGRVRR